MQNTEKDQYKLENTESNESTRKEIDQLDIKKDTGIAKLDYKVEDYDPNSPFKCPNTAPFVNSDNKTEILVSNDQQCHHRNFSVSEDIMIISAYEFYHLNKKVVRLAEVVEQLARRLCRSVKSLSKRVERLQNIENHQIKVLFEYFEKFKDFCDKRKIVFYRNGFDIYLCSMDDTPLPLEESYEFKDIRKKALEHMPLESENNKDISLCEDLSRNISGLGIEAKENVPATLVNTNKVEENDTCIDQAREDGNFSNEDKNDDICDSSSQKNEFLSINNDEGNKKCKNTLNLDEILSSVNKRALLPDNHSKRVNYLKFNKSATINFQLDNEFENNPGPEFDHIKMSDDNKQEHDIINDAELNNLVLNTGNENKISDLDYETTSGCKVPIRSKKSLIDITAIDIVGEGYNMLKKRYDIFESPFISNKEFMYRRKKCKRNKPVVDIIDVSITEPYTVSQSIANDPSNKDEGSCNEFNIYEDMFEFVDQNARPADVDCKLEIDINYN